jgi:hypothetical protein
MANYKVTIHEENNRVIESRVSYPNKIELKKALKILTNPKYPNSLGYKFEIDKDTSDRNLEPITEYEDALQQLLFLSKFIARENGIGVTQVR